MITNTSNQPNSQQALDAARTASASLAAIQNLSERQVAALSGLDAAVKEQVRTISVATQQGLISLSTVGWELGFECDCFCRCCRGGGYPCKSLSHV